MIELLAAERRGLKELAQRRTAYEPARRAVVDETACRENTGFPGGTIPSTGLRLQPEVSPSSGLLARKPFTDDVLRFLARKWQ